MTATEGLQEYGNFTITANLPDALRVEVWDNFDFCVTPSRLSYPTHDKVIAHSFYSARVYKKDPGEPGTPCTISGEGLLTWLGDHDGIGAHPGTAAGGTTTEGALEGVYMFGTPANTNGIALGEHSDLSGDTFTDDVKKDDTIVSMLKRWCGMVDPKTEFRITAQGEFQAAMAGSDNVFVQSPTVVITRYGIIGKVGNYTGMRAAPLKKVRNAEHNANYITQDVQDGDGSGAVGGSIGAGSTYGFDGTTEADLEKYLADASTTDTPSIGANQQNLLTYYYASRYEWTCHVDAYCLAVNAKVGDHIYVHDLHIGATDTGNAILFGGRIHPEKVRITGWTFPFRDGYGVYVIRNATGANTVIDLTDYFIAESGAWQLRIDDRPDTLSDAVLGTSR